MNRSTTSYSTGIEVPSGKVIECDLLLFESYNFGRKLTITSLYSNWMGLSKESIMSPHHIYSAIVFKQDHSSILFIRFTQSMRNGKVINVYQSGYTYSYISTIVLNKFINIIMFYWATSVSPIIQAQYAPWFHFLLKKGRMAEVCWFWVMYCRSNDLFEVSKHPCMSTTLLFWIPDHYHKTYL